LSQNHHDTIPVQQCDCLTSVLTTSLSIAVASKCIQTENESSLVSKSIQTENVVASAPKFVSKSNQTENVISASKLVQTHLTIYAETESKRIQTEKLTPLTKSNQTDGTTSLCSRVGSYWVTSKSSDEPQVSYCVGACLTANQSERGQLPTE
jgi:hypothetical protein